MVLSILDSCRSDANHKPIMSNIGFYLKYEQTEMQIAEPAW